MPKQITTHSAPAPGGAYSQAMQSGRILATAGQVGIDPITGAMPAGLEDQVRLAIQNLEAVLNAGGSSFGQVVKTTCFLADIGTFDRFNAIYAEYFPEPRPARSTVGVSLAHDLLFEIEAIAEVSD
jgi:2-iminobutanoate/2-iminopropanoate deaminase